MPTAGPFRAIVAEDHRSVEVSVHEYVRDLAPALIVLAAGLMAAFFIQITVGLAPLEKPEGRRSKR